MAKNSEAQANEEDGADLETRLIQVISDRLGVDKANINLESRFQEDLGADSLDIVELLMEIEEKFGVTIPDEDAESLKKVQDAVTFIRKKKP